MKKLILSICAVVVLISCSSDDDSNLPNQCELDLQASFDANQNFQAATDENYEQACNAYRVALQNQKVSCGDADGAIQNIIESLGDCTLTPAVLGDISVTAGTLNIVFDVVTITMEGNLLLVSGATSSTSNNYSIYFEVQENMVGEGVLQNFEIVLTSTFTPVASSFTNSVTTNDGEDLTGTFSGTVENNDGGQVELTVGNFNLSY